MPSYWEATSTAKTIKTATCEACGTSYVYEALRQGFGMAHVWWPFSDGAERERAGRESLEHLGRALEQAVEPVPCPKCGWLQKDMVAEAKWRWGLRTATIFLGIAALPLAWGFGTLQVPGFHTAEAFMIGGTVVAVGLVVAIIVHCVSHPNRHHAGPGFEHVGRASKSKGVPCDATSRLAVEALDKRRTDSLQGKTDESFGRTPRAGPSRRATTCPHCDVPLTSNEATRSNCPVCNARL